MKIMMMVDDVDLRTRLAGHLTERGAVIEGVPPSPEVGPEQSAAAILAALPDAVLMDYRAEDALSVKILQAVSDQTDRVGFIFVDSSGQADRENIMMAINEGAQAFVPPDVSAVTLQTYLNRLVSGPVRLRRDGGADEIELQKVNERLTQAKTRLKSAEKLIAYLLSTPLSVQPRKCLILSDSGYQREVLKKHLEDNNFVVLTASAVKEAVSAVLSERPRIVVSDYELDEGQTGVDFCREIKFAQKFTPCYFVVCTANQDKITQIMTPGNGVDDCLLKPASTSSLNEFLARVALGLIL
ncbi:MAG: response regulator [Deltaproteobacteria bacterium]|jgi:DNA-binding response OmpR family regulator|nr:response regulator [Deltaproteobacteria bacterium]